jgi:hypothetical protein
VLLTPSLLGSHHPGGARREEGNVARAYELEPREVDLIVEALTLFRDRRAEYVPGNEAEGRGIANPGSRSRGGKRIDWSIADPAFEGDTDDESYPAFARTVAEIETPVRFLLHRIRQRLARR